jgi:hypothetical protein
MYLYSLKMKYLKLKDDSFNVSSDTTTTASIVHTLVPCRQASLHAAHTTRVHAMNIDDYTRSSFIPPRWNLPRRRQMP